LTCAKHSARGRVYCHTLSSLECGDLQEGKFADAEKTLATAKAVADRDKSPGVSNGYAAMKARQIIESGKWEKIALPATPVRDGGAPGYDGSAAYLLAAGLGAAKLGDLDGAGIALERLRAMRTQAESGSNAYRAKPFAIMEKEVAAAVAVAKKDVAGAEQLL